MRKLIIVVPQSLSRLFKDGDVALRSMQAAKSNHINVLLTLNTVNYCNLPARRFAVCYRQRPTGGRRQQAMAEKRTERGGLLIKRHVAACPLRISSRPHARICDR